MRAAVRTERPAHPFERAPQVIEQRRHGRRRLGRRRFASSSLLADVRVRVGGREEVRELSRWELAEAADRGDEARLEKLSHLHRRLFCGASELAPAPALRPPLEAPNPRGARRLHVLERVERARERGRHEPGCRIAARGRPRRVRPRRLGTTSASERSVPAPVRPSSAAEEAPQELPRRGSPAPGVPAPSVARLLGREQPRDALLHLRQELELSRRHRLFERRRVRHRPQHHHPLERVVHLHRGGVHLVHGSVRGPRGEHLGRASARRGGEDCLDAGHERDASFGDPPLHVRLEQRVRVDDAALNLPPLEALLEPRELLGELRHRRGRARRRGPRKQRVHGCHELARVLRRRELRKRKPCREHLHLFDGEVRLHLFPDRQRERREAGVRLLRARRL
mmetsp:Transcript_13240/g.43644  ORF Transcript_13240/g.43644 Transcript_13240/m.43644 type:complete len:396 (+) Transcript_13240:1117-2304(+)